MGVLTFFELDGSPSVPARRPRTHTFSSTAPRRADHRSKALDLTLAKKCTRRDALFFDRVHALFPGSSQMLGACVPSEREDLRSTW